MSTKESFCLPIITLKPSIKEGCPEGPPEWKDKVRRNKKAGGEWIKSTDICDLNKNTNENLTLDMRYPNYTVWGSVLRLRNTANAWIPSSDPGQNPTVINNPLLRSQLEHLPCRLVIVLEPNLVPPVFLQLLPYPLTQHCTGLLLDLTLPRTYFSISTNPPPRCTNPQPHEMKGKFFRKSLAILKH